MPDSSGRPRRSGVRLVLAALLLTSLLGACGSGTGQRSRASTAPGYTFLDRMMDRQGSGTTLRLPQSYLGGYLEQQGYTKSVSYDDAMVIEAYLARGTADDLVRARVIGDSLLRLQQTDPAHDGRIRASYPSGALPLPDRAPAATDVGNMAWVGLALTQLAARSHEQSYLAGATAVADWIEQNAHDDRGAGGYTGGADVNGNRIGWKSTEHNLDICAFFTQLAARTHDQSWAARAAGAHAFALSMYDRAAHRFATGTAADGTTVVTDAVPEDAQSWSYLVLRDPAERQSVDTDGTELAATDGQFNGVSFVDTDRSKVWFEGTAHLALALQTRGGPGDAARAAGYLATIDLARTTAPNHDDYGIVAASHDGLATTDQGDRYYASLHTGTTAWYLLALQGFNPFTG